MGYVDRRSCLAVLAFGCSLSASIPATTFSTSLPAPPSVEFGELYRDVEMAGLFSDQKTFADAIPHEPPFQIVADYERQKQLPRFRPESLRRPPLRDAEGTFRGLRATPKSKR